MGELLVQPLHACWFAAFSEKPCDGPMDKCHLIPRQRLRKEIAKSDAILASTLLWHPALWVYGCRRHHGDFDNRALRVARASVPEVVEMAAAELGMGWSLDRDFGPVST